MKNEIKTIEIFDTVETFKNQTAIEKKECFFILSANELKNGLNKIKPVIKKNNALPILDCILIEVSEGRVKLTGSDLENSIVCTLQAETKGAGAVCISFASLSGYLSTIGEGNLLFTFDFANLTLILKRDNSIFKLTGFEPADFPQLPGGEYADLLKIPANYFVEGINKTFDFVGNDDLRPVMSAICIEAEKDILRFVATNAHVLAAYTVKNMEAENYEYLQAENFILLLNKSVAKILQGYKKESGFLKVSITAENVKFKYQNVEIYSRLIEGRYPEWRKVVPEKLPNTLKVNRKELIQVASRLSQVANNINFKLNGQCKISTEDVDFENESTEFINDFNYKGVENFEIAFSAKFLVHCLKAIDSEKVLFLTDAANRAGLILPMQVSRQADFVTLCMPLDAPNEKEREQNKVEREAQRLAEKQAAENKKAEPETREDENEYIEPGEQQEGASYLYYVADKTGEYISANPFRSKSEAKAKAKEIGGEMFTEVDETNSL